MSVHVTKFNKSDLKNEITFLKINHSYLETLCPSIPSL